MSNVFPRHCAANLPTAVKGEGCYIIDSEGKRYLDACGGAAVSCLGHSNEAVLTAMQTQMNAIAFAHTGFFTSQPAEDLAAALIEKAPEGLERVYLVSGGSEATEAALKLARQYHVERGEPSRKHIIARLQSYHGNTLGALSAGGNMWRREPFEPLLIEMSHIEPCYAYRHQREEESIEAYALRAAQSLEDEILRLGAENVAAFIAEPVVGATMGAVPAEAGYYKRIREICNKYGVLLILDEVMCGMGRTGHLFACEADGISPDILCIAKGLGAGYQPIGAMLASGKIYETIKNGSGFFQHGHTYIGHPTAAAAALAVLQQISTPERLQHISIMGEKLRSALDKRFGQHPFVGDIRGRGLFIGLELVEDRSCKKPFNPALKLNALVKKQAMAAGLMCYPMGGTLDGKHGDHVLLAPPFIIEEEQVTEIVDKLDMALIAALQQAGINTDV
ncbi:aspartate aminotransferase family protein [Polycladidibacter hongkongensis]|uniref:aspartate aminotransferase family protein n=1 Tax=Polycladidibacter hongkongensis TaxID=1647556 RepID=UPI00082AE591|nr:aspartate aminotransferase family protein [Pseudovibrio hongkongensis]